MTEPWLLRAVEVAQLLRVSRSKVFEMMAGEELPVVRIGRCVRVPRAELADWLSQRTSGGSRPRAA